MVYLSSLSSVKLRLLLNMTSFRRRVVVFLSWWISPLCSLLLLLINRWVWLVLWFWFPLLLLLRLITLWGVPHFCLWIANWNFRGWDTPLIIIFWRAILLRQIPLLLRWTSLDFATTSKLLYWLLLCRHIRLESIVIVFLLLIVLRLICLWSLNWSLLLLRLLSLWRYLLRGLRILEVI